MFYLSNENEIVSVHPEQFYDGTLRLHLPQMEVRTIVWAYENDAELFTLMCIKGHYNSPFWPIDLYMPYIPHARMDRVEPGSTDVFTLKYFCEAINSMNFAHVIVMDPHSNVSCGLLDRVVQVDMNPYIEKVIEDVQSLNPDKEVVLFFPDEGAKKRYKKLAENYSYTYGVKTRNWDTGKLSDLTVIDPQIVEDKVILIVDDICSRGGTFKRAAASLKEHCADNIYLYVSHAEDTMYSGDMYREDDIVGIYTIGGGIGHHNELDELHKVKLIGNGG